tara:strand:+ start:118 stop:498 length:381 start_codon:yes stop_codon:yes gene_type:complete
MRLIFLFILFFSCSNKIVDKSYYSNNQIRYEIEKDNDKEHGIAKYWDENGNLINTVEYFYGQIHGDWIRYYSTGEKESITSYEFNKKNGYEITYYKNGNMKSKVLYKDDKQVLDIIRWNRDGTLMN